MGWCSGNELAEELYDAIRLFICKENRKSVATEFFNKFSDYGADAWDGDSRIEQDMEGNLSE
jgi:hypothetical protein